MVAVATLATFMFAGVNVTWGNMYDDASGSLGVNDQFGVWFDLNDATSIGPDQETFGAGKVWLILYLRSYLEVSYSAHVARGSR